MKETDVTGDYVSDLGDIDEDLLATASTYVDPWADYEGNENDDEWPGHPAVRDLSVALWTDSSIDLFSVEACMKLAAEILPALDAYGWRLCKKEAL